MLFKKYISRPFLILLRTPSSDPQPFLKTDHLNLCYFDFFVYPRHESSMGSAVGKDSHFLCVLPSQEIFFAMQKFFSFTRFPGSIVGIRF